MPKLREQITIINNALKFGNFNTAKFQAGNWMGLAYQLTREEEAGLTMFPSLVDNNGEGTDVTVNDNYPIQFYHRIVAPLQYPDMATDSESFGDGKQNKEIAELVMICVFDRSKVDAYNEEICAGICSDFPKELTQAQCSTLSLISSTIENVETNTNSDEVFAQEYSNVANPLPPECGMVSVKYRITSIWSKDCFVLCN